VKQVQAVIRPDKLDAVKDALVAIGVHGLTVIPVQGFGQQFGHTEVYRGVKIEARLLSKLMLISVVPDDKADAVIEAFKTSAHTGEVGDGKVWVLPVETSVRIRTGESGDVVVG
jgi:nitrogen regulatory protein PII